jgi:2-C-methyl-D-erythritol 2,4-cyclodiphosphate synthase
VGIGHDVHPLGPGRPLILGGFEVPHTRGLAGHSDGDVLSHAIADALIGAAGGGDIGQWFPDTDERYRGIQSLLLLTHVATALNEGGWAVGNVDATVVAQRPRIGPFLSDMRANIAQALDVDIGSINVKATSPEYVGSLGREDGIAAFATVLIERRA